MNSETPEPEIAVDASPVSSDTTRTGSRLLQQFSTILIFVILLLAFALRIPNLNGSFWYDETHTYERSERTIRETLAFTSYPLYYLLGHVMLWMGDTEWLLRLPGLLASIGAIWLLYVLGCRIHSRTAGLFASFFAAISAFHINYAQEARYYGLLSFFGLAAILALDVAVARDRLKYWAIYALMITLVLASHPIFVMYLLWILVGSGVMFILTRPGKRIRNLAKLAVATGVGCIPFALAMAHQFQMKSRQTQVLTSDESREKFTLTAGKAWDLLRQQLPSFEPYLLKIVVPLAVFALLTIWWRRTTLTYVLTAALVGVPATLRMMPVAHPFAPRYFILHSLILFLLMGIALGQISSLVSRLIIRWNGSVWVARIAAAAGVFLSVIIVTPFLRSSSDTYKKHLQNDAFPREPWKTFVSIISNYVQTNDVFIHYVVRNDDWWTAYSQKMLNFYLAREATENDIRPTNNEQILSLAQPDLMQQIARRPYSNIWIIEYMARPLNLRGSDREALPILSSGVNLRLRGLGEPTVNQVQFGSFEDIENEKSPFHHLLEKDEQNVVNGKTSARLHLDETNTHRITRNIKPHQPMLRNGGFQAWSDGVPAGWEILPGSRGFVSREQINNAQIALGIMAKESTVTLSQTIDLSGFIESSLRLRFKSLAAGSSNSRIVIALMNDSDSGSITTVPIPTGKSWRDQETEIPLPSFQKHCYLKLELQVSPGAGKVMLDDLVLARGGTGTLLRAGEVYTLSAWMKYKDVRSATSETGLYVRLFGVTRSGGKYSRDLFFERQGSSDWKLHSWTLDPEKTPELLELRKFAVEFGFRTARGTAWIDSVQLEAKPYPTFFVDTIRVPHDEEFKAVLASEPDMKPVTDGQKP